MLSHILIPCLIFLSCINASVIGPRNETVLTLEQFNRDYADSADIGNFSDSANVTSLTNLESSDPWKYQTYVTAYVTALLQQDPLVIPGLSGSITLKAVQRFGVGPSSREGICRAISDGRPGLIYFRYEQQRRFQDDLACGMFERRGDGQVRITRMFAKKPATGTAHSIDWPLQVPFWRAFLYVQHLQLSDPLWGFSAGSARFGTGWRSVWTVYTRTPGGDLRPYTYPMQDMQSTSSAENSLPPTS